MIEKLNKKLAGWAGFTCYWEEGATDGLWHYPDEAEIQKNIPDFTESLDACFKHLYPELKKRLSFLELEVFMKLWVNSFVWREEELALAFCLAIEKLIDEGEPA